MSSFSSAADHKRRRENWTIAAILAFQIALPLSYYLSHRAYDERFSWRMFSTLRLRDCKVQVTEQLDGGRTRKVDIERDVHVAWLRLLERMRSAVIDAYLERRGENEGVTRVSFVCRCNDTDGHALPALERSLSCRSEVAP
jgi:hypothetical protein